MKKYIFMALTALFSMRLNASTAFDATVDCLPNEVQLNAKGEIHFGAAKASSLRYFLVRNQYDVPLVMDFLEGHIGASAGLTQRLAPRGWTVYLYNPHADGLRTESGEAPPFWSCAKELPSGSLEPQSCASSIWVCALSKKSAAELLSVAAQEKADVVSHSFWLPVGDMQYQSVYFLEELRK